MGKYIVSMAVDCRLDVTVEADSPDEAFEAAKTAFLDADLSEAEVVGSKTGKLLGRQDGRTHQGLQRIGGRMAKEKEKEKEMLVRVFCEDSDGRMPLHTWPLGQRYDAYSWLDRLLWCTTGRKFSLMSELDDLQSNDDGEIVFANKRDIPLRIVNLVLATYNITVTEE